MFERALGKEPKTYFAVALDDETVAMLIELAEACAADPRSLIAAIVKGVLVDDREAHLLTPPDAVTLQ